MENCRLNETFHRGVQKSSGQLVFKNHLTHWTAQEKHKLSDCVLLQSENHESVHAICILRRRNTR